MFERSLAHHTLKSKHLIGEIKRVTMDKINLELSSTRLMDQGIQIEPHGIAIAIHSLDKWLKLVGRINTVGLACRLGSP